MRGKENIEKAERESKKSPNLSEITMYVNRLNLQLKDKDYQIRLA